MTTPLTSTPFVPTLEAFAAKALGANMSRYSDLEFKHLSPLLRKELFKASTAGYQETNHSIEEIRSFLNKVEQAYRDYLPSFSNETFLEYAQKSRNLSVKYEKRLSELNSLKREHENTLLKMDELLEPNHFSNKKFRNFPSQLLSKFIKRSTNDNQLIQLYTFLNLSTCDNNTLKNFSPDFKDELISNLQGKARKLKTEIQRLHIQNAFLNETEQRELLSVNGFKIKKLEIRKSVLIANLVHLLLLYNTPHLITEVSPFGDEVRNVIANAYANLPLNFYLEENLKSLPTPLLQKVQEILLSEFEDAKHSSAQYRALSERFKTLIPPNSFTQSQQNYCEGMEFLFSHKIQTLKAKLSTMKI